MNGLRLIAATSLLASAAAAQDVACGPTMRRPGAAVEGDTASPTAIRMRRMTDELRARGVIGGGRVQFTSARGWLGIRTSEISEMRVTAEGRVVRYCDYPVVVSVEPGSPAAVAGVEARDTLVAYNGSDLRDAGEVALDRLLVPGDTLRVTVRRGGRALTAPVVVGRAPEWTAAGNGPGFSYVIVGSPGSVATAPLAPMGPDAPAIAEARVRAPLPRRTTVRDVTAPAAFPSMAPLVFGLGSNGLSALAGAQVAAMDDDLRAVVGAKGDGGVLVLKVGEGTPASEAGLRSGDVIVTADGATVTSPGVFQQALLRNRNARSIVLHVERRGKAREVTLRW